METVFDTEGPVGGSRWRLDVGAVFEQTTRAAGIAWRLTPPIGAGEVHARTLRSGRTLVYAELAAVRAGVSDARRRGARHVEVHVPGRLSARLLAGRPEDHHRRAARVAARVRSLFSAFESVRVVRAPAMDSELSRAMWEALEAGLRTAADREDRRLRAIEEILRRSRDVRLEKRDGTWIANGRYRVSLDPLNCECPAWTARWARAPIAGRRAQRLLCKHLVALATRQGVRTPAELSELARRAPG